MSKLWFSFNTSIAFCFPCLIISSRYWLYSPDKSKKELFLGFKEYNIDGQLVKIASKEKIIIDFLTYRRKSHDFDLVIEKLKNTEMNLMCKDL